MNVYLFELKSHFKYPVIWAIVLLLAVTGFLGMYPTFSGDIEAAKAVLEKLPIAVRQALNLNIDLFFSFIGFYSYIFNFILLAGSIMSLNLGLKIFSEENTIRTAEFLNTKPISRTKVFAAKTTSSISLLIIFNILYSFGSLIIANIIDTAALNTASMLLINGSLFIVQLIFLMLGMAIGCLKQKIKSPISLAMPIVLVFFIVAALDSAIKNIQLANFTPFKFFDRQYIITNSAYQNKYLFISTIVLLSLFFIALAAYKNKDIKN